MEESLQNSRNQETQVEGTQTRGDKKSKKRWVRIVMPLIGASILFFGSLFLLNKISRLIRNERLRTITTYEECVEAGYPVIQPYPVKCKTPDGRIFTEEIKKEEDSNSYPLPDKEMKKIPFGMANPPIDKICDYPLVGYFGRVLFDSGGKFNSSLLDKARSCGTKVFLRLSGQTNKILNDNGVGINLSKFEDRISQYQGLIDPYIEDGTIIYHFTIDEPHDCHDWGGQCPSPSEVDEASKISKKYWPNLKTMVNTLPDYASKYQWQYTDLINFQYAYHKGPLDRFISAALSVYESGKVEEISWSIMAKSGGYSQFGKGPMTPEQVEEVGKAMCDTGKGVVIAFVGYKEEILTLEMYQTIERVKNYCGNK